MGEAAHRASVEAYLELEARSQAKHEYVGGAVVAMAGASPRHNRIVSNLVRHLDTALDGRPCHVWGSDQRVRAAKTGSYFYPDVTVTCENARFTDERPPSLENPLLLVEVLSPSTEEHDRGAKLAHYRRIPSVREVLLVEANELRAELYRRLEDGGWLLLDVLEGDVELASVGVRLSLEAIYAKTEGLPLDSERA